MARLKVAVVGNCQAGGIADALNIMGDEVTAMPFMVHTIAQERREAAFANLRKYDVILSQPIKSFGVLNTDSLQTLNKPVITYPNIYFRGFHPDICFLGPGGKRIRTPLANNNSLIVLLAYLSGASEAECRDRFTPETYEAYGYGTVWDESREILRRREAALDIHVAQFFDHPENAPNLYVMNHPSMEILSHVGSEALRFMGRDPAPVRWDVMPDRLRTGSIWPRYRQEDGTPVPPDRMLFKAESDNYLDLEGFIAASYRAYDKAPRSELVVSSPGELLAIQREAGLMPDPGAAEEPRP